LSAIIITRNEAKNIAACLQSVAFCDERIVVDSGSTDDTVAIAADCGAQVTTNEWAGFGAQKNFALSLAQGDWVLSIDADERVTPASGCTTPDIRTHWIVFPKKTDYPVNMVDWRQAAQLYAQQGQQAPPTVASYLRNAYTGSKNNLLRSAEKVPEDLYGLRPGPQPLPYAALGDSDGLRVGDPPSTINYDLWLGPSPFHPYNSEYFKGGCLHWNMHWDWGTGQVGDMGSHTMDLAWNAIEAGLPTTAEGKGDPFNPEVTPVKLVTHFDIPANSWRDAIKVSWYQGGAFPECPFPAIDLNKVGHGVVFEGSSGALIAGFGERLLMPQGNENDLTYYKQRPKSEQFPPIGNFEQEWIKACKGNLKTSCDFGYATDMIEMMLLGLVAYRVGKKIKYDGATGKVMDSPEANELLRHTYRKGWTLDG
jgi:hypothetical protein